MRKEIIGNAELYLGDCLEILPTLPKVDSVITDPPYTQRTSENMRSRRDMADGGAFIGDKNNRRIDFDGVDGLEAEIAEKCLAVTTRWVLIFCALEQIGTYQIAAGKAYVRGTAWHRTNPAPQFTGDRPGQAHEGAVLLHNPGKKRWNRGGSVLAWHGPTINSIRDRDRGIDHPTPKPVWIMRDAVDALTDASETILDPFMGSGTTGVACMNLGRKFIGIEVEEKYFDIACRRIDDTQRQSRIFGFDDTLKVQERIFSE